MPESGAAEQVHESRRSMSDKSRRKELKDAYRERARTAGGYRVVNKSTGRYLLATSATLDQVPNKLAFARSTGNLGVLDLRLKAEAAEHVVDAFEIEVLEEFEPDKSATDAEIRDDLAVLEALWKDKLDPAFAL
jgi:hypothetical protein